MTVDADDCDAGTGIESPTVCAHPAAPAWANAMLDASYRGKKRGDIISQVARHMGQGATFDGYAKDQPEYAGAVYDYLVALVGAGRVTPPADAVRPGWECTA